MWLTAALAFSALCSGAGSGTLEPGDWPYRELDALSRTGLLSGHPARPLGDWAQRLTRYEAASLTLRAVEGLGKAYQRQGELLQQIASADQAEPRAPAAAATATLADVARVEKLIEEFRAELITMGARADDLAAALKDAQARLAQVEAERKRHQTDGYLQVRYQSDHAPEGREEFLVRRARVNLRGPVSERASYRVEMQLDSREQERGPGSKAQLRTAYVDYQLDPRSRVRVGQAKVPWGYELLESSSDLWSAERAFFMDRLFPQQRDIGVQASYRRAPSAPQLDLGVFNGTGINANDNNDRKNVMARANFPVRGGEIALSGYAGSNREGAAAARQDRTGVSARCQWGETRFVSEFVTGSDRDHKVRGWYAQLGRPVRPGKGNLVFAKYDMFDENRALSNDLFRRWTFGYWCDLDKATRLTLAWELRKVQPLFSELASWDGNAAYAQMQVRF